MTDIIRQSPVAFSAAARRTEMRDNWPVVLEYADEAAGPWLADLSHKTRWDLQDGRLDGLKPLGMEIPSAFNACSLQDGVLINRMNRTQCAIWHLQATAAPLPDSTGYTDVSEAAAMLALFGPKTFAIAEKLSNLDMLDPTRGTPFLLQGPFAHLPCQLAVLERGKGSDGGLVLTCSRGYGRSMAHAILDAGAEFGLRPAGEERFSTWLAALAEKKTAAN